MTESTQNPEIETLATEPPAVPVAPTAGVLLRQARERSGVHLGMLSVALKVPVRQLMALEADDHTPLSSPVFVRALAGSVCRHLKMDATPVLALLPQASSRLQAMPPSLDAARPEFWRPASGRRWTVSRQFLLLVVLMLGLIALIVWLPEWPTGDQANDASPPPAVAAEPAPPQAPMVVLMPSETSMDAAPGSAVPGVKPAVPAVSTTPTAAVTASALPAASTASAANAALDVTFKGKGDEAWVEVQDRTGTVVFSKLVKAGETHVVKGVPVLTVVVGLADAVEVSVRGQTLDLTPFSRGAVARFEVK